MSHASRGSHPTIILARSNRSGADFSVKTLPEYDKCQDFLYENRISHNFRDYKDVSRDPSYTDFKIPYNILCQVRYTKNKAQMEEQFQKELKQLLDSMESAYEAARFMRHMCITTFWPPLHNRQEIQRSQEGLFKLNKKQRKHLNYLMETKII